MPLNVEMELLKKRVSALEEALNETNRTVAKMILQEGKEEARLDEVVQVHNLLCEAIVFQP